MEKDRGQDQSVKWPADMRRALAVVCVAASVVLVLAALPPAPTWARQDDAKKTDAPPPNVSYVDAQPDKAWVPVAPSYAPLLIPKHPDISPQRATWADEVRKNYDFSILADNISAPGNAAVEGGDFIRPGAFPTAEYCGHCHQQAYAEWRQALHSNSFRTPFYRNSVNLLMHEKGIQFARHCDSCHNPIAVLGGAMTAHSIVDRQFDHSGLTCSVCHSVVKLQSTLGNGSFVLAVPAVMTDASGKRIPGEVPYADILMHPDWHARAVMQPIMHTPEFCAACHQANLPEALNGYKFLTAFSTYQEWQASKFSHRNPLTFYTGDFKTCQACHMEREPITLPEPGAKNGTFASHRWTAGNTAVPFYYGFDDQLRKTIEFLQSGNYLNIDLFGLDINGGRRLVAPLGQKSFDLHPGDIVQTYVVIQNKNIGHSLIPEVRDLYEAWVKFDVTDDTGKTIYHSGFVYPDGSLDRRAHSFTNRPVDENGEFVDNHRVWAIHSVAYDNTISAGRSVLVRYEFKIPDDAKGDLKVSASVEYRHFRKSYVDNVFGKDHPAYPIVELASRTRTLTIGENKPEPPDPADNPEWMRWNNAGIGYLDELQYARAVDAFDHVVKLRPDYADGYTNIALTEIAWEKFGSARHAIHHALALSPDSARALYYRALIERSFSETQAEIDDLKRVVAMYPESRDARRALGVAYFGDQQSALAIEQFQALQALDPDDVAAHYNLALLYRRTGMKEQAREQALLFATKKTDPGAPTYSFDYLRQHPEIVTESAPWHLHTDLGPATVVKQLPQGANKSTWQY